MSDPDASQTTDDPLELPHDDKLETYVCGIISEALGKAAESPRDFASFTDEAARCIVDYVLANFRRTK